MSRSARLTRLRGAVVLAVVATSVAALAACSSEDPGAIHFGAHATASATSTQTTPAAPAPTTPATSTPDSGIVAADPDAGTDAAAAADAAVDAADAAPLGPAVVSFTLINTAITNVVQGSPVTGQDPMLNNSTINLGIVGTSLSIRANLNVATIGSVGFAYDATNHTEGAAPYVLCGDDGAGVITNCNIAAGTHTLTATPYSLAALGGTAGHPLTITFTLAQ